MVRCLEGASEASVPSQSSLSRVTKRATRPEEEEPEWGALLVVVAGVDGWLQEEALLG